MRRSGRLLSAICLLGSSAANSLRRRSDIFCVRQRILGIRRSLLRCLRKVDRCPM